MRLLLQPEHGSQADRHFDATRTTLKYYGEWFGAYPYGHITIVDPAYQSGAGGMEYPTLFTAGTRWLAPAGSTTPEGVTVHEAGHQFWYGMVGEQRVRGRVDGRGPQHVLHRARHRAGLRPRTISRCATSGASCPWVFNDIALSRETEGNRLAGYRRDAESDVPSTPSFRYFPATGGSITYNKTALWLNTLERWLGWPMMQRIMSTLFRAVAVQASEAGRLLRDGERRRRPRSRARSSTRCTAARTSSTTASRICKSEREGGRFRTTVDRPPLRRSDLPDRRRA